jgi:hypothetical protein
LCLEKKIMASFKVQSASVKYSEESIESDYSYDTTKVMKSVDGSVTVSFFSLSD